MRPTCHGLCATARPGHTLLLGAQQVAAAGPRGADASGRGDEGRWFEPHIVRSARSADRTGSSRGAVQPTVPHIVHSGRSADRTGSRAAGFLTHPPQPELLRSVPAVHALGPRHQLIVAPVLDDT